MKLGDSIDLVNLERSATKAQGSLEVEICRSLLLADGHRVESEDLKAFCQQQGVSGIRELLARKRSILQVRAALWKARFLDGL